MSLFDPFDPLDAGVIAGVNAWAKRAIFRADKQLYNRLFDFANYRSLNTIRL